jgi:hypothetical protein
MHATAKSHDEPTLAITDSIGHVDGGIAQHAWMCASSRELQV